MAGKFRVTVVGEGNIGGTTALRLALRNYADVVLVDIIEDLPQGKALDILESGPILPCATYLRGEYDIEDLFVGVPVKLGAGGVEEIIELDLTDDEREDLEYSANDVREMVRMLNG